jgi:hypothetical protein
MVEAPRLDALTAADFTSRIGQTFRMRLSAEQSLELTLVEVHTHKYAPPAQKRQGFSIVFRSDVPGHVPQATYALAHEEMGALELFLVPVGSREGGMCYEAVFN